MSRLIWHRVITKFLATLRANLSLKIARCLVAIREDAWSEAAVTVADDDLYASQLASLCSQGRSGRVEARPLAKQTPP